MFASIIFFVILGIGLLIIGAKVPYLGSPYADVAISRKFLGASLRMFGLICFAVVFLLVVYQLLGG